jgi:hypothetical protein
MLQHGFRAAEGSAPLDYRAIQRLAWMIDCPEEQRMAHSWRIAIVIRNHRTAFRRNTFTSVIAVSHDEIFLLEIKCCPTMSPLSFPRDWDYPKIGSASLILGAGFSWCARFPLAAKLFETPIVEKSARIAALAKRVRQSYGAWKTNHPNEHAEAFIDHVYHEWWGVDVRWRDVIEYISLALAYPMTKELPGRSYRNSQSIFVGFSHPVYSAFWAVMRSGFGLRSVVTLNYDLLIERTTADLVLPGEIRDSFRYGGLNPYAPVRGLVSEFDGIKYLIRKEPRLYGGRIPLFKLHGSLNWSIKNKKIVVYEDIRPAFRLHGDSLIIPPLKDKPMIRQLRPVWEKAEHFLATCDTWIVCGYSLPEYDVRVSKLLRNAVRSRQLRRLIIMDPCAKDLVGRWEKIIGKRKKIEIICFSGLPQGLVELISFIDAELERCGLFQERQFVSDQSLRSAKAVNKGKKSSKRYKNSDLSDDAQMRLRLKPRTAKV